MANLTFYTNPMSRGRTVRWMLEEIGEPYETVILDYEGAMKTPDYLAINPMGKVPAIVHEGTVVTETAAICAYLADAFPAAGLAPPPGDARRGPYFRWMFFAAGPLEAAMFGKAMNMLAPPDKERMVGYGTFDDAVNAMEKAFANGRYLCGDDFTAADLYVGALLGFGTGFGMLPRRPAFVEFVERVQARPAYKRALAIDEAASPEQES
jgi:glutathione S-transferase